MRTIPLCSAPIRHPLTRQVAALLVAFALAGCGSSDSGGSGANLPACSTLQQVVVTDIDETLTTSDGEFLKQVLDGTYDPAMRAGASDLMQGYSKRGYFVFYLTARATTMTMNGTGQSAQDATFDWLQKHGFPVATDRTWITLSDKTVTGADTATFKAAAIEAKQGQGYTMAFAYGNATTDIDAYGAAQIPKADTFIVGTHAGEQGTQAIQGEDYVAHDAAQLPQVDTICAFR